MNFINPMRLSIFPRIEISFESPHVLFTIDWWPSGHITYVKPFWGIYRMEMDELAEHVYERMNWLIEYELYDEQTENIVICEILPALAALDEEFH